MVALSVFPKKILSMPSFLSGNTLSFIISCRQCGFECDCV